MGMSKAWKEVLVVACEVSEKVFVTSEAQHPACAFQGEHLGVRELGAGPRRRS